MYEVAINESKTFRVEQKEEQLLLDNQPVSWSCVLLPDGSYNILYKNKSYRAECLEINKEQKSVLVKVGGHEYRLQIREPIDRLLKEMGFNGRTSHKVNQIKAPMPGMILKIMVEVGQQLQKDDPLLILEAMKMENVFKAPEAAVVKEIKVKEQTAVEKGQVLIVME